MSLGSLGVLLRGPRLPQSGVTQDSSENRRRCGGIHLRNASCGVGWRDCGAWQVWHPEGRLGRQAGADAAPAAGFLLQEISGFALKAAKRLESGPPTLSLNVSRTGTCASSPASDAWLLCGCGRLPPSPRSSLGGTALRFWFRPPGGASRPSQGTGCACLVPARVGVTRLTRFGQRTCRARAGTVAGCAHTRGCDPAPS